MINLDKKDKKILYYLLENSRQSYKSIGKKVGASKELIAYRIKRMIQKGVIKNFKIICNFEKLGYALLQTHYKFVNVSPRKKEEILTYLVNSKFSMYVSLIEGIYDLQIELFVGKANEFEKFLDVLREKYRQYLIFKLSKIPIRGEFYNYNFLMFIIEKQWFTWIWGQDLLFIDNLDFEILTLLSKNCRIPLTEIANNLRTTVSTVNNRIKKLEQKNVIAKYTINVDWSKLGYRWFHLQISLNDYKRKNEIIHYMRNNPNLIRRFKFLDLTMDLHFTLLLKDMNHLHTIIEDISAKFPDIINDYQFYSTYKIFKYNFVIPEIIINKNPLNRSVPIKFST